MAATRRTLVIETTGADAGGTGRVAAAVATVLGLGLLVGGILGQGGRVTAWAAPQVSTGPGGTTASVAQGAVPGPDLVEWLAQAQQAAPVGDGAGRDGATPARLSGGSSADLVWELEQAARAATNGSGPTGQAGTLSGGSSADLVWELEQAAR